MTRGSLTELDRKQVFHPFTSIAAQRSAEPPMAEAVSRFVRGLDRLEDDL